jgi:hypothetical protein
MVETNRWGHRDDNNYEKEPAPGVFRIALIGSSNSMGTGVPRADMFERLVEEHLNKNLGGQAYERFEVVNFSVPRYHLLERVYIAEQVAPEFKPDLMLIEVTMRDLRQALYESVIRRIREGRDLHFDFLKDIVKRANVKPEYTTTKIEQRLQRFEREMAASAVHHLAEVAKQTGTPVALLVLRLEVEGAHQNSEWLAQAADREGIISLRVFDAYNGRKPAEVYLIPNQDYHPTVLGHHLLADEIYADLMADPLVHELLTTPKKEQENPDGG